MSAHLAPAFEAAAPERRWTSALAELFPALRKEAWTIGADASAEDRENDRDFTWRILPSGAVVSYRIRGDENMRGELRLARQEPLTEAAIPKWNSEVATFLRHFDLVELDGHTPAQRARGYVWRIPPSPRDEGHTVARFIDLRHGEIRPDMTRCASCGREWPWWPAGGVTGQRCNACIAVPGSHERMRIVR